jgi:hypothetical protein
VNPLVTTLSNPAVLDDPDTPAPFPALDLQSRMDRVMNEAREAERAKLVRPATGPDVLEYDAVLQLDAGAVVARMLPRRMHRDAAHPALAELVRAAEGRVGRAAAEARTAYLETDPGRKYAACRQRVADCEAAIRKAESDLAATRDEWAAKVAIDESTADVEKRQKKLRDHLGDLKVRHPIYRDALARATETAAEGLRAAVLAAAAAELTAAKDRAEALRLKAGELLAELVKEWTEATAVGRGRVPPAAFDLD